jgi:3-phosphoshikimate 1-carboxyvinyltransferase
VEKAYLNQSTSTEVLTLNIAKGQKPRAARIECDWDWSSVFVLAVYAARGGWLEVPWLRPKEEVIHPDIKFLEAFKQMGINLSLSQEDFRVQPTECFSGLTLNCLDCPDLVPVLASLSSFAQTDSIFEGVSHLVYKESNRLTRMVELIRLAGGEAWVEGGVGKERLKVRGVGPLFRPRDFDFDPRPDHRLWMAAQVFRFSNRAIKVRFPEVCRKSFPELPAWVNGE